MSMTAKGVATFLLDAHGSHVSSIFIDACWARNIAPICFAPHVTHIMQPLDVSVFGPIAQAYTRQVNAICTKADHIDRIQLINMYNKARKEVLTQSLARQAFSDSAFTTNPTSDKILARTNLADAAADINGSTTLLVSNKQRRESDRHTSRCLTSVCRRTTIETGLTQRESSSMPLMSVVQNEIYCCSKTRADKPPRK